MFNRAEIMASYINYVDIVVIKVTGSTTTSL